MKNNYFTIIVILVVLLINKKAIGQQTSFSKIDSIENYKNYFSIEKDNIFMIGEIHNVKGCYLSYFKIIKLLAKDYPLNIIIERGESFSTLINLFLLNKDSNIILNIPTYNEEERDFYKNIRFLNIENNFKIKTIGIDIEYQKKYEFFFFSLNYFITQSTNNDYKLKLLEIRKLHNKALINNNFDTIVPFVQTILNDVQMNYNVNIKLLLENYLETIKIESKNFISWPRSREKLLYCNFLAKINCSEKYIGIIGTGHLPNNKFYPAFFKRIIKNEIYKVKFIYPIYFNHYTSQYIVENYYDEYKKKAIKKESPIYNYFDKKRGDWLLLDKGNTLLIISN